MLQLAVWLPRANAFPSQISHPQICPFLPGHRPPATGSTPDARVPPIPGLIGSCTGCMETCCCGAHAPRFSIIASTSGGGTRREKRKLGHPPSSLGRCLGRFAPRMEGVGVSGTGTFWRRRGCWQAGCGSSPSALCSCRSSSPATAPPSTRCARPPASRGGTERRHR